MNKKDGSRRPSLSRYQISERRLQDLNVLSLPALRALHHVKLHCLAFLQAAEAIGLNRGVVDEYVLTIGAAQKSKALRIVKPFHCSLFHN